MINWVKKGLKTGIVTTSYPSKKDNSPGITPGLPKIIDNKIDENIISTCPTNAIYKKENKMSIEPKLCIHCFRCLQNEEAPILFSDEFEWAIPQKKSITFPKKFNHSINICVVDTGDCGACLNETKLLNNPYYNMHRLGFFITPTPRKADILLVTGAVTRQMRGALLKAYEAMPTPKKVIAVGTCAINGGIFKDGFVDDLGLSDIVPVDIVIPGCPPPPLAILDALLMLSGNNKRYTKKGK